MIYLDRLGTDATNAQKAGGGAFFAFFAGFFTSHSAEFYCYYWFGSLTMLADGFHNLSVRPFRINLII